MNIELIWAQDEQGGIGKNGKLPWQISEDLKNFKKITSGFPVIMGRKTWNSLPFKPLPNRRNIVLSSSMVKGVETYESIQNCINKLENESVKRIFIIGGESIYKAFYAHASVLHLTTIYQETYGVDVFFPISTNSIKEKFNMIESSQLSQKATYTKWVLKI